MSSTVASMWLCVASFLAHFVVLHYFRRIACQIVECFFALVVSFLSSAFTDTEKVGGVIFKKKYYAGSNILLLAS